MKHLAVLQSVLLNAIKSAVYFFIFKYCFIKLSTIVIEKKYGLELVAPPSVLQNIWAR